MRNSFIQDITTLVWADIALAQASAIRGE